MQTIDRKTITLIARLEDEGLVTGGKIWRVYTADGHPLHITGVTKERLEQKLVANHYNPALLTYDEFTAGQWVQFNESPRGTGKTYVGQITHTAFDATHQQPLYYIPFNMDDPHGTRWELRADRLRDASLVYDQPQAQQQSRRGIVVGNRVIVSRPTAHMTGWVDSLLGRFRIMVMLDETGETVEFNEGVVFLFYDQPQPLNIKPEEPDTPNHEFIVSRPLLSEDEYNAELQARHEKHPCELCGDTGGGHRSIDGHNVCPSCFEKIEAYEDKVQRRLERMQASAEKAMDDANATVNRAREMASVIPFGQPILVGHHSEGRDRRYRARIENTYRRGFEAYERAKRRQERVKSAEQNGAVSSDDPAAVLKLREKLAKLEADQELMRATNKVIRKHSKSNKKRKEELRAQADAAYRDGDKERSGQLVDELRSTPDRSINVEAVTPALVALGYSEKQVANLLQPDFAQRVGVADYMLSNNNANIRRIKGRIEELTRKASAEVVAEEQHGDIQVVRDTDDNRIRLVFPDKPDEATRAMLKANGFRWSPSNKAWQRQLNGNGEYAVQCVLKQLTEAGNPVAPQSGASLRDAPEDKE